MALRKLLALALLLTSGCATGPAAVQSMDAAQIQTISDYRLCDAAAVGLDLQGQQIPVIEGEIARRGISCAEHIASVVSDCSMLEIVGVDTGSATRGAVFTVRNYGDQPKSFRIYRAGVQSSLLTIEAGDTQEFGIAVDPNIAGIGSLIAAAQGGGAVELNQCRTAGTPGQFNYRPQAEIVSAETDSGQSLEAASAEQGMSTRAIRNVNMRTGPGTNNPSLGILSAGTAITVLRVDGAWCDCLTRTGARVYVNCAFLSPPPGGWMQLEAASSASMARFVPGTPYPEVRRQLLADGWQPFRLTGRYATGCPANFTSSCSGFAETTFCTGTGQNSCWYTYRRGDEYLLAVAGGESGGGYFAEMRRCASLAYSQGVHPWEWCSPVAPQRGQVSLPRGSDDIRLTPVPSTAGGSNCSLYLDRDQRTLFGEAEYAAPMVWTIGVNGKAHRFVERSVTPSTTRLATADGAITITINRGRVLRSSRDPSLPFKFSSVTVEVTMAGRSATLPAFQFCGEG